MGPEDGSMSCVPEAPLATSSSCGATRKGSTQPRRQQPTRSCTSNKSIESVVVFSRGDSASPCLSQGKGKRRSDTIRRGHARTDDGLGSASIASLSSGHRTPGTPEDKATVPSCQPPGSSGRGRGNAAAPVPPGPRRRCLRSDTRREQEQGGGFSGSVPPFFRASGGGNRVETPPGSRSKDQGEKSRAVPYKRTQPLGGFQSPESSGKGNVNAKKRGREEKESDDQRERHRAGCRGPQRAAAAAAVARLNSSRHLEEMADQEENDEDDGHKKGKARAHVQQSQSLSQGPTEEAPPGAAAFASGFVESLSDGSGGGEGDVGATTGVHAPPQTSGGSLEKVWNAISATYFQDPLVVKDIVSSLLIENGDTNFPSTKSNHSGAVSGGQSLPRWAASNSGGGLSGPGRGGGGGESSLWAASPTRRASAGGNSSLRDRSWVPAGGCGVRGWEAPGMEGDSGNSGVGDWAGRCNNVKRSWTGCKGVPGMGKAAGGGGGVTCRESVVAPPSPEPKACEGSSPAVPIGDGRIDGETSASSATESASGLSVGSGSDYGSAGTAAVKEEPICSDVSGGNSDEASVPAPAFLTPKTECVPASECIPTLSTIESSAVETQPVESSAETEDVGVETTGSAYGSPPSESLQASSSVPMIFPQAPSIVMPLPLSPSPPPPPPPPSPHRVDATFAGSPEQSNVSADQLGDASHHPQPPAVAEKMSTHVDENDGVKGNATTTAGTPDRALVAGVRGIDAEATSSPEVPGDSVQGKPLRVEEERERSDFGQTHVTASSPISSERTTSACGEIFSTSVGPSLPRTEHPKPASLPSERFPSNLQPQPRPRDQLVWPPVPSRSYPSGFVGMLSSGEATKAGASPAGADPIGNPHADVVNSDCPNTSWCHQRPLSVSPSRDVHGPRAVQPRNDISSGGVGGSSSCGGGSEQQHPGREVDEVSLRLASVSEALTLLEDAAILPSLYRVSDALRVELDRRAEDRAKATAASRIERTWRSACHARSSSSRCPAKRSSRAASSSPRGSGSGGMDSDTDANDDRRMRFDDGSIDRGKSSRTATAGGELWHQSDNGGVMIRGGGYGDVSDDEWSPSGRGSKRRRCARRSKLARKRRARVGGSAASATSNSESESESAAPLSSNEDGDRTDENTCRTKPKHARMPERESLFAAARSASRKLRSQATLGGGMGRLSEGRSRRGGGGDGISGVRGWEKTITPRRKLACLSGSGGASMTFVSFAANSPESSNEDYMSSSDVSTLGSGSRGSGGGRRRYGDRGYGEASRKRHICRELTCTRRAHYGSPGWVPAHCVFHRRDWEVLLKYACCLSEGCVDKPAFGVPGDLSRVYCRRHRVPGAVGLASAGWKLPEDSREAEAGGWVEAEEDGMGVPVDEVEVEEAERQKEAAAAAVAAIPAVKRASSAPENATAIEAVSRKLEAVPVEADAVEGKSVGVVDSAPVEETVALEATESDPVADDLANGSTTSEASVAEEVGSLMLTEAKSESPHAATSPENGVSAGEEASSGGGSGCVDGTAVDAKDDGAKRKGRWFREVGKGIAVLKEIGDSRDGSAGGARVGTMAAKKMNGDKRKSISSSGKLMKGKGKAKSGVGEVPRDCKRPVGRRSTRSATLRSSDTDDASDSNTFSSQASDSESESESESDSGDDGDDEDIVDDPVFAPGRFMFLVPSKKCDRPILVGKIVPASESLDESSPPSDSASPPPPTIPVSSTTALLLAKAAALLVGTSNPDAGPGAAASMSGAGKEAPDPAKDEERRWIHVHWHTPASLNRKDYCRGPFTPDYVKKEGSKFGGWDPFVTKIRKKSVMVTCPGLLVSRCIPAEALRELGV